MHRLLLPALLAFSGSAIAAPPIGTAGWSADLRTTIPDVVAVDLALRQSGLKVENASMIYGRTLWRADGTGIVHRHATIGWRLLSGSTVLDEVSAPQGLARRVCTIIPGHDPVPGGRKLQLYRQAPVQEGELDSERKEPRFILGTGEASEVLITALRPGDQIQITEAIPVDGGPIEEHVELNREGRRLSLTREGTGSRVCLSDGS